MNHEWVRKGTGEDGESEGEYITQNRLTLTGWSLVRPRPISLAHTHTHSHQTVPHLTPARQNTTMIRHIPKPYHCTMTIMH